MRRHNLLLSLVVFALFAGAIAVLVPGCRAGGGGYTSSWGSDSNGIVSNNVLSGVITQGQLVPSFVHAAPKASLGKINAATLNGTFVVGAWVYLEELPAIGTFTDALGKYELKNVPAGNYHVVAAALIGAQLYKVRSLEPVVLAQDSVKTEDLAAIEANNVITGVLRDAQGNFLPQGTKLTLWGETFEVGPNGTFTTPPLPGNVTEAEIKLFGTTTGLTGSFLPGQSTFVEGTLDLAGTATNHAPSVVLKPYKGTTLTTNCIAGEQLTIKATGFDPDTADQGRLTISWETDGNGTLSGAANAFERTWTANNDSYATITATVKDLQNATGTSKITIMVGPRPTFTLTVNAATGTIALNPVGTLVSDNTGVKVYRYEAGTSVILTPNDLKDASSLGSVRASVKGNAAVRAITLSDTFGFGFANWSGDLDGSENPKTIVLNANTSVTANYKPYYYVSIRGSNGTVARDPNPTDGLYLEGTPVTFTVTPTSPFEFIKWSKSELNPSIDTENPKTLTIANNVYWTAICGFKIGTQQDRIYAGYGYSLGIKTDGTIYSWGSDYQYLVSGKPNGVHTAVTGSVYTAYALQTDGTVVRWGATGYALPPGSGYSKLSATQLRSLALKNGEIIPWGYSHTIPNPPVTENSGFSAIAAGEDVNVFVALKTDGTLIGWGGSAPYLPPPPTSDKFVSIAQTNYGGAGVEKTNGGIVTWGYWQPGLSTPKPTDTGYVQVVVDGYRGLALKSDGSLSSWGNDLPFRAVEPPFDPNNPFVAVSTNVLHSLALRQDGTVVGWGTTMYGLNTTQDLRATGD